MIPLPAEEAGEVYHRCSVSFLAVFPQQHLTRRNLAQGKEAATSQAAGRYRAGNLCIASFPKRVSPEV